MSDIFDEIKEDLQQQKLQQFWKENGSWVIGSVIAAIILTGAMSFWQQWRYSQNMAATRALVDAVTVVANDPKSDLAKLDAYADGAGKNHAMIARFMAAYTHVERGEKEAAVKIYDEIAGTSGLESTWRDLAKILSVGQRLDKAEEQDLDALVTAKNPWRYTALEMQALIAARKGDAARAKDILSKVADDPAAPQDARARAFTLREFYAAEKPAS